MTTTQKESAQDVKPKPKTLDEDYDDEDYDDGYYDVPDERPDNYTADYFPPY